MNYGLYISASGLSTQMARQDVLANNLANVNTTAFKPDAFAVRERAAVREEDGLPFLDSNTLLERLGGGVMPVPTRISFAQGSLQRTSNPLDVGIEGEGFLLVQSGEDDSSVRLTRDGRLTINAQGELITVADGYRVLNGDNAPIRVDPTRPISIRASGAVIQNGSEVGQLALVAVSDPTMLRKAGAGLYAAQEGESLNLLPATGRIMQEFVEESATDPIRTMTAVTSASRAVSSASNVIGYINEMMGRAVNTLGRTS